MLKKQALELHLGDQVRIKKTGEIVVVQQSYLSEQQQGVVLVEVADYNNQIRIYTNKEVE